MHINSQCFLQELLLFAVPRIAVKEHPRVAQPETQAKGMLIISTITVSVDQNVVKVSMSGVENLKDLMKKSTNQGTG
jgi:hypothetical protein